MREALLNTHLAAPKLTDVSAPSAQKALFIQKCEFCAVHCSMSHYEDPRIVEAKRDGLKELVNYAVNYT